MDGPRPSPRTTSPTSTSTRSSACSTASGGSTTWWTRRGAWASTRWRITDHGALYGAVAFYQAPPRRTDQADHRRRDLRRAALDERPGGQGGLPAVPPDPAREGLAGLPEPVPARHRRAPRRLLLQAAHRPGVPREVQRGPRRPVRLPQRRGRARAGDRGLGPRAQRSPGSTGTSSARTASSSSSRTTAWPSSAGSTSSCCASRPEVGLPLVVTNDLHYVTRTSTRPTTCCSASARGNNLDTPNRLKFETQDFYLKTAAADGGPLPGPARGASQHPPDRRDGRPAAAARPAAASRTSRSRTAHTVETWLRAECQRGLARALRRRSRRSSSAAGLRARRDHPMGYAGYFLIVADFVRFAREQGIATTCRGSAPG